MVGTKIVDFELPNTNGEKDGIAQYQGKKNVVVILLRNKAWPYCQKHLRDLNKDIDKFKKLDAVVYPILSDSEKGAKKLESKCDECQISIHFDKKKDVVKKLNQEVIPWKLGRMPAVLIADIAGTIQ